MAENKTNGYTWLFAIAFAIMSAMTAVTISAATDYKNEREDYWAFYGELPEMPETCEAQQAPTSTYGPTREETVNLKAHQLSQAIRVPAGQMVSINSHCLPYETYWSQVGDTTLQTCGYQQGSYQNRDGKAQWDGVCRPNVEHELYIRLDYPGTVTLVFLPNPPPQPTSYPERG